MWTYLFWRAALERAIKTCAQMLVVALTTSTGAEALGFLHAPWASAFSLAAMGFVLSLLTSLVSGLVPTGDEATPSLVDTTPKQQSRSPGTE